MDFKLVSDYKPQGDQATAIESLSRGVHDREQHQVLLGVTGSGKTYTMAKVIEAVNRPKLITECCCSSRKARKSNVRTSLASWWRFSTSAPMASSAAERIGCVAT